MDQHYNVIVVGAGPAGSSTAASLAESGYEVAVLEKDQLPRSKPCAGGLVIRGLRRLPNQVLDSVTRYCHETVVNVIPAGLSLRTKKPEPILGMVMRKDFDHLLAEAASSAGATVFDGCEVKDVEVRQERVHVISTKGTFTSRYLIAADGALSRVARKTGVARALDLVPAIECEIQVNKELLTHCGRAARFDIGFVPQGYGWVFPKKDHLSVGVGRMRKGRVDLDRYMDDYLGFLGLKDSSIMEKRASVISLLSGKSTFAQDRVLLTGDAAGLADPLTAEGISNAVLSGQLAAQAIRLGGNKKERVARHYTALLQNQIIKHIRLAKRVGRWIYDYPSFMCAVFAIYGERICEGMMEVMSCQKSYMSLLLNPITYLRPLRLGGSSTRRTKIDKTWSFR
ncbi:MAG TPA: geranylgeranyl reductase family protein [Desulfobacterales bacterium]|nr:geranylgeranyl reductase family protein [Desulfobacterales bacterium]